MLIERSQALIGIVAAVALLALTGLALLTTGGSVLVRGDKVLAEFDDASGLNVGDFVFVSGVRSGSVTDITTELRPQSDCRSESVVMVEFAVTDDGRIPVDSEASIILANTLGKRGIAITPGTSQDALFDGDGVPEIPCERTNPIVDIPEFGDRTEELLSGLDVETFRQLTVALADVTEDQRQDVDRLLDGVQQVADVLVRRRDQLESTIASARELVDVLSSRDQEIVQIIDNFGTTLDTLIAKRAEIIRLLDETADTTTNAADLVAERRVQIDQLVASLSVDLGIVDDHLVDLSHALAYGGVAIDGFSSIGYLNLAKEDAPAWGNVFVTGLGPVGVQALLGCGSDVDDLLTSVFGPDPRCDGLQETPPEQPEGSSSTGSSATTSDGGGLLDGVGDAVSNATSVFRDALALAGDDTTAASDGDVQEVER